MSALSRMRGWVQNLIPTPVTSTKRGRNTIGSIITGKATNDPRSQLEAPIGSGTLFAVQDMLKTSVAQAQWGLFDSADGNPFTQEPWAQRTWYAPDKHPAAKLLDKPNPFMGRMEFMERVQQTYELTGEGWASVEYKGQLPIGLWPVRPDRIEPVTHPTKYLIGYIYTSPDGEKIPLKVNQIVRLINPHPLDPHRGLGAVQAIGPDIDASSMSAEWVRAFFRNNAQPGGVIEVPDKLSEEQFQEMYERWQESHSGTSNAGKVGVLENAHWVDTSMSMVDMQFVDMRRLNSDSIKQAFAFPKAQLGEADDVNRANAEAQHLVFARNLVRPRLFRWRELLNNQLLPLFPEKYRTGVQFEFMDPVSEDRETEAAVLKSRSEAAARLVEGGWQPDDALAVTGLPPMRFIGRPARVGGESILIRGDGSALLIDSTGESNIVDIPAP